MAETGRRTTMENIPGRGEPKMIQIGHGQSADIFLDLTKRPSVCYKIPYQWPDDKAIQVKSAHTYLRDCGFPVLPHFEVAWGGEFYEMTDLTNGLTNLVVSAPDVSRVEKREGRDWFSEWHNVKPRNEKEFLHELDHILQLCVDYRVGINDVGLFLVATPEGKLKTIIADYEDGILHHRVHVPYITKDVEDQKQKIMNYFNGVVKLFFPSLHTPKFSI
ncbi:hypothetical protein COY90_01450 [Candidatus Roizmanbacteria bacterium CG_4_10_14_0_8_um_filter_39_9]|uniref:Uncharacterized protein n=1 Tax=Candidatus Roizmanbacteria bacterium CG_4_10_14_0_8_um_filter_39_9 TaxID=1974829 RepID=A0A2M7QDK6_9BACT|nr:MAG: hypothetical protein COY90_01450 [Candidatus Roizmanbacteria bacterium CG_4_10_14_0_8_um_filter_39_9]